MICNKCGTENLEESIFCSVCGSRLDGKKKCIHCNNFISQDAVYCNFCGGRVDGKKVCNNCGNVFTGNFCNKCGEGNVVSKNTKSVSKEVNGNSKLAKIVNIISSSLLLLGIVFMFIASFFMGTKAVEGDSKLETSFYYFGKAYKDLDLILGDTLLKDCSSVQTSTVLLTVFATIFVATNLIIGLVSTILALIKLGKGLYKKESININSLFAMTISSFIACVVYFMSFTKIAVNGESGITVNSILIIAMIIALVVAVAVMVLKLIQNYNSENLKNRIFSFIGIALVFTSLMLLGGYYLDTTLTSTGVKVSMTYSSSQGMGYVAGLLDSNQIVGNTGLEITDMTKMNIENLESAFAVSIIIFVIFIVSIVVIAWLMAKMIKSSLSDEIEKDKNLTLSVVFSVLAIVYMVMGIILMGLLGDYYAANLSKGDKYSLSIVEPIIILIISVLTLGVVIAKSVISKKNK